MLPSVPPVSFVPALAFNLPVPENSTKSLAFSSSMFLAVWRSFVIEFKRVTTSNTSDVEVSFMAMVIALPLVPLYRAVTLNSSESPIVALGFYTPRSQRVDQSLACILHRLYKRLYSRVVDGTA